MRTNLAKWVSSILTIGFLIVGATEIMPTRDAEGATVPRSYSVEFHEGQKFPTMVFPSLDDGRPRSVADFRGKKLILHIFASW